jgi:hypothetical protein
VAEPLLRKRGKKGVASSRRISVASISISGLTGWRLHIAAAAWSFHLI